ncbi:AMP-binding protein [Streptomyces sp. NPDC051677]|uniref:AMP-binding protein n=1 Tax=Streptomyces sp. NPDC051677 TaxID=3365669 RepID=UPI0037D560E6
MTASTPSYASGTSRTPLLGETIGENFDRTCRSFPDQDALVDLPSGRRWTYGELHQDVSALALALLRRGVAKGDRVGIWAPSSPEWFMLQYATAKIGAILVPVNPAYRAHELQYVLDHAGVGLLVSAQRFKTSDYTAMIDEVRPSTPTVKDVVYLDSPAWEELTAEGRAALAANPSPLTSAQDALSFDDAINIQYTSGTTGFPKGATLSHHAILNNGYFIGELLGYTEQDRVCVPVPFYHCFGMVIGNLACTTHGAAIVIPARSFEPVATLQAIDTEKCTSLLGVPTMFIAQLAVPDFAHYDLSHLRTGAMGGAPCPVEVMKQVIERMGITEIAVCYGMTETAPISMLTRRQDSFDKRVTTVGRVLPHLEVKLVHPVTGAIVPRGEPGEFCTRGYSVMKGYWQAPEQTAASVDPDRWMHSGDIGVMDEDGYVAITGRMKDMVIRGGENIYPREIEEFLHSHPDILDAQVIGVPDATYGEELMAWIKLRDGAPTLDAAALKDFCTGKLAHFKIPRFVHVIEEYPMTVTGKIRKVEMREMAKDLLGLKP